jgi:aerobic-type carbon monoxide dehydrogenase small subunit (CoxS/CutS family)
MRLLHAGPNLLGNRHGRGASEGGAELTEDLVAEAIPLSHDELRERMSGNLCRCGAYNGIVDAITDVYAEQGA